MTPNISREREAEIKAWLDDHEATDKLFAASPSFTRDLYAMLDQARADAAYFDNLTKMKLQSLIQNEPEGADAASLVYERVIDCFRRLKRERDFARDQHAETVANMKTKPTCSVCDDTGVIDTGNNDLPCSCPAGDTAVFNLGVDRTATGAEVKRHYLNGSPEPRKP